MNDVTDHLAPGRPTRILIRILTFIEEDFAAILLALSIVILCADVVGRYIFNHPVPGAASIAMVCFIWLTYLGAAAVARRGRHIAIDVLIERFNTRWRAITDVFVQLIVAAVFAYVLYWVWVATLTAKFVDIPGLHLSRRILTLALLVGFMLMALYCLRDLVTAVRGSITGRYSPYRETVGEMEGLVDPATAAAAQVAAAEPVTESIFIKKPKRGRKGPAPQNGPKA